MSELDQALDCFICSKHRAGDDAEGGILYQDDLVYAGHVAMGGTRAYRGHLVVEPRRHVEGIGLLDDTEAARIGWLTNRLAALLRAEFAAEHVYSFVLGGPSVATPRTPAHLHVHVLPRYPGTPQEFWGASITRWPDAPRVDPTGMRDLVARLRVDLIR